MTKEEYFEQRKDPRWQKLRLEVMQRDGFKCRDCSDELHELNVHHSYYVTGRPVWEYPLWSLKTLCRECHSKRHKGDGWVAGEWESSLGMILHGENASEEALWDLAVAFSIFRSHGLSGDWIARQLYECAGSKTSQSEVEKWLSQ